MKIQLVIQGLMLQQLFFSLTTDVWFQLCKMYEEYLEVLFKYSLKLLLRRQKKSEASVEQQRVSEEQQKASEEQQRTSAEQLRPSKGQQRASEEQQRASEEQQRVSEEQQRASEEQQRSAVQASDVNNEDTTTLTRNETVGSKGKDNAESETETQHDVVPNPDAENVADACQNIETTGSVARVNEDSDKSSAHVEIASESSEDNEYAFSELHFNFTALLLWLSVTLINVPCVLVWAHNYR
jgi:hypothetical protein